MTLRAIALVVPPVSPEQPGRAPSDPPPVAAAGHDRFADALRTHTRAQVILLQDSLRAAPPEAMILLAGGPHLLDAAGADEGQARRVVLLNAERPPALLATLERWGLGGAIERQRYADWRRQPERETGGGLFGLRTVAGRMGATCFESKVFASEHYCSLRSDCVADLPGLVVGYLEALAAELAGVNPG